MACADLCWLQGLGCYFHPCAPAGITDLPPEIGKLRRLEGLQVEGVALKEPLASLYKANPLLLVQVGQ
jgi:hypothetical protein